MGKNVVPVFLALLVNLFLVSSRELLHPLVIIPGRGGNQLQARLTSDYKPSTPTCGNLTGRGWFRLWLDYTSLHAPVFQRCFAEQMHLYYDAVADDYFNAPGVGTRVPFFGSTRGFLYQDPNRKDVSLYMAVLVKRLREVGYREGENLFGAPYDFRYGLAAPGHPSRVGSEFLRNLKQLIEKASVLNDNKPAIILTHSLGGLFALQLLNRNPRAWSQRFVKHLIALSAPWGGTVVEMLPFASGDSLGYPFIDPLLLRQESRSSESNLWLLPNPRTFASKPLVISRRQNFSSLEMPAFLEEIGFGAGVYPYESRISPLIRQLVAPGVPVTIVTGVGIGTAETLVYGEGGFDETPEIVNGDGDGLVNLASLLAPENDWAGLPDQFLKVIKIPNVTHTSIVSDPVPLRVIIQQVNDVNSFAMTAAV